MKPKRSLETLKISRYDHGGGRIYFDDGTDRELVADTYHEADRELIYDAIKASLAKPAERKPEEGPVVEWAALKKLAEEHFEIRAQHAREGKLCAMEAGDIDEAECFTCELKMLGRGFDSWLAAIHSMRRAEVEARVKEGK